MIEKERRKKDVKINHIDRRTFYKKDCCNTSMFNNLSKEFKDSIVTNIVINKILNQIIK